MMLLDVLDYLSYEVEDFNQQATDRGIDLSSLYNEYEVLMVDMVPKDLRNHIYYKTEVLKQQLVECIMG